MVKRTILIMFIALLFLVACSEKSNSSKDENEESTDYPTETIEMIVPFDAGSTTDATARLLQKYAEKYLPNDVSMVVVNKAGGKGAIGMTELANSDPDGYTIGHAPTGPLLVVPATQDVTYGPESFDLIAGVASVPHVLVVASDSPWETFDEWLEYVKQNPGDFNFAYAGATQQIHMLDLEEEAGLEYDDVNYDSDGESSAALLRGDAKGAVVGNSALTHIESGDFRPLVYFGNIKPDWTPDDVPAVKDVGYDVGMNVLPTMLAPTDIPQEIFDILVDVFDKVLNDPELMKEAEKMGRPVNYMPPDEITEEITKDYKTLQRLLED